MANDMGPDFHYVVRQAEGGTGDSGAAAAAPRISLSTACCYCHDKVDRKGVVYCATCMAPHHLDCFREHGLCATLACGGKRTVSLTTTPPPVEPEPTIEVTVMPTRKPSTTTDSGSTSIAEALAALRETQGRAFSNTRQTKLAADATQAAVDSGVMKTAKFKKPT